MMSLCDPLARLLKKARRRASRGKRDGVSQAAAVKNATVKNGDIAVTSFRETESPSSPVPETTHTEAISTTSDLTEPFSFSHRVEEDVTEDHTSEWEEIWRHAYENTRNREPDLMADFEKHLTMDHEEPARDGGLLSSPESIQVIVSGLQEARKKRQWRVKILGNSLVVREQVEKLGQFLLWSDKFVTSALSSQPYASLAWSGVSMLTPLLSVGSVQHEAMLKGFTSVCDIQMYWWSYKERVTTSVPQSSYKGLPEALSKLFSLVLEYQARVICHLSARQLSRAWDKTIGSDDWASLEGIVKESHENCQGYVDRGLKEEVERHMMLQSDHMARSRATGEKILQTLEDGRRESWERQLLQILAAAAPGYEGDKDFNPKRVAGTCEWFFSDWKFCNWRDNPSSNILWVTAGPGCGKSVLSRTLIDEGHLDNGTTVEVTNSTVKSQRSPPKICYFFFKDGDAHRMDLPNALCAILHQLFRTSPDLMTHAYSSHKSYGQSLATNCPELWRILMACAKSSSNSDIVCVLDALDECHHEWWSNLVSHFEVFEPSNKLELPRIKFLITSRPYDGLESRFRWIEHQEGYIRFDGDDQSENIRHDIDLVIDVKVDDLFYSIPKKDDRDKIRNKLKKMDNRTYLWLHLTWDIITNHPSAYGKLSAIETLLRDIPPEVADAYEAILERSPNKNQTEAILQLVLAATRPLTVEEANVALAIVMSDHEFTTLADLEKSLWDGDFKSVVKNSCGLFVNVYDSRLFLIHQTAREFLTAASEPTKGWKGRFDMQTAHKTASMCCQQYLFLSDLPSPASWIDLRNIQHELPFLEYASQAWNTHWLHDKGKDEKSFSTARALCSYSCARVWIPLFQIRPERWEIALLFPASIPGRELLGYVDDKECTDLQIACYLGFRDVAQHILAIGDTDINPHGLGQPTALCLALRSGLVDLVELLLRRGADINVRTSDGATVLIEACRRGYKDIAKLLLEKNADMNVVAEYGTALTTAARNGHGDILDLLLSHNADADQYVGPYETPLSLRPLPARDEIPKVLLPITGVRDQSLTLLMKPLCRSRGEFDLFLSRFEELDPDGRYRGRIADMVAFCGNCTALSRILDRWADQVSITESLMMHAVAAGSLEKLELLIDRGKSNARAMISTRVILAATYYGTLETMQICLDSCNMDDLDSIPEKMMMEVVKRGANSETCTIAFLMDRYGDGLVTEEVFFTALRNCSVTVTLENLWPHPGRFGAAQDIMETAAGSPLHPVDTLQWIRQDLGDDFVATNKILQAAAGPGMLDVLQYLVNHCGGRRFINEAVLQAAAGSHKEALEKINFLMYSSGGKLGVTDLVLQAATTNFFDQSPTAYLFNHHYHELNITENTVKALADCAHMGCLEFLRARSWPGLDSALAECHDSARFLAAARGGDLSTLKRLLDRKVNPDKRAANGWTPLMAAALNNRWRIVEELAHRDDVDVNSTADDGMTPLFAAHVDYELGGYDSIARNGVAIAILLKAGADPGLLPEHCKAQHYPWLWQP